MGGGRRQDKGEESSGSASLQSGKQEEVGTTLP